MLIIPLLLLLKKDHFKPQYILRWYVSRIYYDQEINEDEADFDKNTAKARSQLVELEVMMYKAPKNQSKDISPRIHFEKEEDIAMWNSDPERILTAFVYEEDILKAFTKSVEDLEQNRDRLASIVGIISYDYNQVKLNVQEREIKEDMVFIQILSSTTFDDLFGNESDKEFVPTLRPLLEESPSIWVDYTLQARAASGTTYDKLLSKNQKGEKE